MTEPETIIRAAVKYDKGVMHLPIPARHGDVLRRLHKYGGNDPGPDGQGFLTNTGRFVSRKEGYTIAKAAGQIIHKSGNLHDGVLYSEDMW